MNTFRLRLLLDFLAAALIIACLAYWWLDNLSHELFGAALFSLVILHNVFNRRWYAGVAKRRMDVVRVINLGTIICLGIGMSIMLVTSLLVSRDLFPVTGLSGAFAVREIHMFAGYWVLLIVAIHLGTRWDVVMNAFCATLGMRRSNPARTWAARILALGIALWGLRSISEMGFGSKLMLSYSLDMWDFNETVLGFFLNYAAIAGLFAIGTHYSIMLIRPRRKA